MLAFNYLFEFTPPGTCKYRERSEAYIIKDRKVLVMGIKHFEFPGGGLDGDTPEEAVKREALEEVGIKIKIIKKLPTYTYDFEEHYAVRNPLPEDQRIWNVIKTVTHPFICEYQSRDKSVYNADGDASKYKWLTYEEAVEKIKSNTNHNYKIRIPQFLKVLKILKQKNLIQ